VAVLLRCVDGRLVACYGATFRIIASCDGPSLCFSPDFKKVYVVDISATDGPSYPAHIMVFDVTSNGTRVSGGKVFANFAPGFTDGVRCDADGNVWCGWGWGGPDTNGVRVHAPSGDLLAFIHTPEVISNLVFGDTKRNRLFMTGSTSIYALYVNQSARH
jgi:gluconolactonase